MSVLQVFKSLPVAHDVMRADALPASASGYVRDTITLDWEGRLKARGRRRSDGGTEFGTALPRGTVLRAGDCLVCEPLERVFVVVEREETVLVVEPRSPLEWGLFGYHIGNSHQPVMFTEREIVCADLPGMDQVLEQHGIAFTRATRTFTPVGLLTDHRH
jgi:urease accessory protein UreE